MLELAALVGAIALIMLVLWLRAMLALPFARQRSRWVDAAPPSALLPLYDELGGQLAPLGFVPPRWMQVQRVDGEPEAMPLRAVYRHADGCGLLVAGAPVSAAQPHRLTLYYCDLLADGRWAVSQPFDTWFALVQGDRLIARSAGELEPAAQWQAHRDWVRTLGAAPQPVDEASLPDRLDALHEQQRQWLLQRGSLRAASADLATPRVAFALRLLRGWFGRPKAPVDSRPVPAERLAMLARVQEIVRHRSPPKRAQWALFAGSVGLFMALGALLWDLQMALAILVVVLIHEFGHFAAMRAFGYRNVHILALPLVGGVAMGEDTNPAALRRAWMSLMGPLPGIVIGWVLLAVALFGGLAWTDGWLLPLALVFLFINYLNVLPVPPLDGAHVVHSLLPPRWARVQTVFIGVAAVLGAWLAWQFEFRLLTALALLQLPALPAQWRLHGVERELAGDAGFARLHRNVRLLRVLQAIERSLGPAVHAGPRINQALQLLGRLDDRPMGALGRTLTGAVYSILLLVPVAGLLWFAVTSADSEQFARQYEQVEQRQQLATATAAALPLQELLAGVADDEAAALPPPATPSDIDAARQRLAAAMPDELAGLYAVADGVPAVGIAGVAQVERAAALFERAPELFGDTLPMMRDDGEWIEIALSDARDWWHIGGDEDAPLFYLPTPHPQLPGVRMVDGFLESPSTHAGLREWLQARWVRRQLDIEQDIQRRQAEQLAAAELADAPVAKLLSAWTPPSLMLRMLADEAAWPGPADDAAIAAAEQRLRTPLDRELRELLAVHDGFPPVGLSGADGFGTWRELRGQLDRYTIELLQQPSEASGEEAAAGMPLTALDEAAIAECVVVGGTRYERSDQAPQLNARLLWCPSGAPGARWIDLGTHRGHASLRDWLLPQAVQMRAWEMQGEVGQ